MAPNSLSPAFVVISYHSAFGAHKMTIPTRTWFPTSAGGTLGTFLAWDTSTVDAEAMINALVDKLKVYALPSTVFDEAAVYTKATATAPSIPQGTAALTQVGTSTATTPHKATSATFNFKTAGNGNAKLVLLDTPVNANFDPLLPASFSSNDLALQSEFVAPVNAWSGRDDTQPDHLRRITFDLNDRLQKLYKMN